MGRQEQGIGASAGRYTLIPRVLVFITTKDRHGEAVLLLRGAPDKRIWPNRLNGLGGHVERGEGVLAAARRELDEEAGVVNASLRLRAVVTIDTGEEQGIGMYVLTGTVTSRAVTSGAEGALEWWPLDALPYAQLVGDLPELLPRVLALSDSDPPVSAHYWYNEHDELQLRFD